MNSPPDPGSPSLSTPSSGSPPPEEVHPQPSTRANFMNNIASHISSTFAGGSSKRPLPGGSGHDVSSSNRDPKSRRRGDPARLDRGGGVGNWESTKETTKREKDDLIDNNIVDYLRREIGDPFQDSVIKKYN